MEELLELWKTQPEEKGLDRNELNAMLTERLTRTQAGLHRRIRTDALIAILLSVVVIIFGFLYGLHSRYTLTLAMLSWVILIGLHYYIKYHLLIRPAIPNQDIISITRTAASRLKRYMLYYRVIPPLLTGLFTAYYLYAYASLENGFLIAGVLVLTAMIDEMIIRKMYSPVLAEYLAIIEEWKSTDGL